MKLATMLQVRPGFMFAGFKQGKDAGIMRDGHYDPRVDRDVVAMYCMGDEL